MTKVIISNADSAQNTGRIFLGEDSDGEERYVEVGEEVDVDEKDLALISRNFGVEYVDDKSDDKSDEKPQEAAPGAPQAPGSGPVAPAPASPAGPSTPGQTG